MSLSPHRDEPGDRSGPANASRPAESAPRERITLRTLARMARAFAAGEGPPFAALTAYDATTARWLERAGVHMLLVGDSAAEVVFGFERTIDIPLDPLIALTAAVRRGSPNTVLMADMPFLSYGADEADGVRNAGRFLVEGRADIVKLELQASQAPLVARLTECGIPVCAHVGSKPQHVALTAGYTSAGRTAADAQRIVEDAVELERAGAVMLLVEAVPDDVTEEIRARTSAPLIGIGAGTACHGQILVVHDLLGLTDHPPRFAEPAAALGPEIRRAGEEWVRRVAARDLGGRRYTMREGESERFRRGAGPGRSPGNGASAVPNEPAGRGRV